MVELVSKMHSLTMGKLLNLSTISKKYHAIYFEIIYAQCLLREWSINRFHWFFFVDILCFLALYAFVDYSLYVLINTRPIHRGPCMQQGFTDTHM